MGIFQLEFDRASETTNDQELGDYRSIHRLHLRIAGKVESGGEGTTIAWYPFGLDGFEGDDDGSARASEPASLH